MTGKNKEIYIRTWKNYRKSSLCIFETKSRQLQTRRGWEVHEVKTPRFWGLSSAVSTWADHLIPGLIFLW